MNKKHLNFLRKFNSKNFSEEVLDKYSKSMEKKIKSLSKDSKENLDLILILKRLKGKEEEYNFIRNIYLERAMKCGRNTGQLKYLHPFHYFSNKYMFAKRLKLSSSKNLNILDIGTGAGHFLAIANHYGHNTIGLDIEYKEEDGTAHIYDALTKFYGVKKIYGRINNEDGSLPEIDIEKQDLITGFMIYFNKYENEKPWNIDTWKVFLKNISKFWLKDDGRVFLSLTKGKTTEASWSFLESISEWHNKSKLSVLITNKELRRGAERPYRG
jgi:hypothetical protein